MARFTISNPPTHSKLQYTNPTVYQASSGRRSVSPTSSNDCFSPQPPETTNSDDEKPNLGVGLPLAESDFHPIATINSPILLPNSHSQHRSHRRHHHHHTHHSHGGSSRRPSSGVSLGGGISSSSHGGNAELLPTSSSGESVTAKSVRQSTPQPCGQPQANADDEELDSTILSCSSIALAMALSNGSGSNEASKTEIEQSIPDNLTEPPQSPLKDTIPSIPYFQEWAENESVPAFPTTSEQVAAYLNGVLTRFNQFISANAPVWEELATDTHQRTLAFLRCLRSFGWQVRKAWLCPRVGSFSNLKEHAFWIITPPADIMGIFTDVSASMRKIDAILETPARQLEEWQFILDFHFLDLFRVARPTEAFHQFFTTLRPEFVGTVNDLKAAIWYMSKQANKSLEKRQMAIPPWRNGSFLETSFVRGMERYADDLPCQDEDSEVVVDAALSFMESHETFLRALGFSNFLDEEGFSSLSTRAVPQECPYTFDKVDSPTHPAQEEEEARPGFTSGLARMLQSAGPSLSAATGLGPW